MNINLFSNIIGMTGTIMVVGAYLLLQLEKIDAKGLSYNLINLFGAVFLFISLLVNFNLASFVIEIFWIAASLIGLYKVWSRSKTTK